VFGVDANVSLGFVSLAGEYARSEGAVTTTDADGNPIGDLGSDEATDLYYVTATVAGDTLPLLNSLTANYRNMPVRNIGAETANVAGGFFGVEFGAEGDKPFRFDQVGFGVDASVNLFILDVGVYFDSYTIPSSGADVTAYGATTEVDLFAGFAARGFFRQALVDGAEVRNLGGFAGNARTQNYASELGAGLRHDGAAENALIDGLNLNFEYALLGPDFATPRITAEADYSLTVAGITLDPYVSFVDRAQNPIDGADTTIRAGTSLSTEPLDIFLNPSLNAAANYRTSALDPAEAAAFTAEELHYSVGVTLNEFLFENSSVSARFGSYMGTNISVARRADPADPDVNEMTSVNVATRAHTAADLGGAVQTTTGFELTWDYFDLQFAYGMYSNTIAGGTVADESTTGNRFRIRYVVNF
jgi:hypothetical protein